MRRSFLPLCLSFSAAAMLALAGCGQSQPSPTGRTAPEPSTAPTKAYAVKQASAAGKLPAALDEGEPAKLPADPAAFPLDDIADGDLTMPKVHLSEAHDKLCQVRVGDAFPPLELPDLNANTQSLRQLMGKKLTVVFFWNARQTTGLEELSDLGPQVERRFGPQGVAVVGVNTGDAPKLASELAGQANATFVNLTDQDGNGFAQVGTGKTPRTYLVDASGTIVWFDIEYSRTTRRELSQAIRYLLAQE